MHTRKPISEIRPRTAGRRLLVGLGEGVVFAAFLAAVFYGLPILAVAAGIPVNLPIN